MTISKMGIALLLTVSLVACGDDDLPTEEGLNLQECHDEIVWDTLNTADKLIGKWTWTSRGCTWGNEADTLTDKGMLVEFFENQTVEIRRDTMVETGIWKVDTLIFNNNLFQLQLSPLLDEIIGNIFFCDDQVRFNDTPTDGCINSYRKIE